MRSIKGAKIGAIEAADFCTDPGAGGESLTPKRPELQRLLANLEAPSGWGSSQHTCVRTKRSRHAELSEFDGLLPTPVWRAADSAVLQVLQSEHLQRAAKMSETTSFCPRCGQLPDGDRRMEEARELFASKWRGTLPKRSELDFAIAWAYFRRKL